MMIFYCFPERFKQQYRNQATVHELLSGKSVGMLLLHIILVLFSEFTLQVSWSMYEINNW